MDSVVILAGGKGTRLGTESGPKALLNVNGQTLLDFQLAWARKEGFNKIFVVIGHKKECFENLDLGEDVFFIKESVCTGTAAAVKLASRQFSSGETFWVCNVDDLTDINVGNAFAEHVEDFMPVVKPLPYSIVFEGKFSPQETSYQHIGHTVMTVDFARALPDYGSYERCLAGKNLTFHVHKGLWVTVNDGVQLELARRMLC